MPHKNLCATYYLCCESRSLEHLSTGLTFPSVSFFVCFSFMFPVKYNLFVVRFPLSGSSGKWNCVGSNNGDVKLHIPILWKYRSKITCWCHLLWRIGINKHTKLSQRIKRLCIITKIRYNNYLLTSSLRGWVEIRDHNLPCTDFLRSKFSSHSEISASQYRIPSQQLSGKLTRLFLNLNSNKGYPQAEYRKSD
jgi:hypothetical protein